MKKYFVISGRSLALSGSLFLFLAGVTGTVRAVDVVFTATFQAPTCQVSAPAVLDFGDVVASDIKQGASLASPLPLEITLSQCAGFVGTVQKPGVMVTGNGNTDAGDFLFSQPAKTQAVNYGVRITTSTDSVVANNTFLSVPLDASNFDGGSVVLPLNVALSCGNKCNDAATKSGVLSATVTFDFAYQ